MQANFSDSNLFPQTEYNVASITTVDGLNDNLIQNNSSLLNRSSFELSVTENSIGSSTEESVTPTLNDSRSEEHTSELQSQFRISYAVFCLKKKK